jgi:hypothetical protein
MIRSSTLLALVPLLAVACDNKTSSSSGAAPSATAAAAPAASSAAATASAAAGSVASAAPEASAAPSASAATSTKEVVVTVKDPSADKERTVKAAVGGTVTVYLPQEAGTSWSVETVDKTLGKPKEQTIPGFAGPTVAAHELKWTLAGPLFKAGATHKVKIVQTGKDKKPTGATFSLTIDVVAG